jgi:subtilisin family serine protease
MRNKSFVKYFFSCSFLLASVLAGTRVALAVPPQQPSVINADSPKAIPGQYIIVFKPGTFQAAVAPKAAAKPSPRQDVLAAQETAKKLGGTILHTYTAALIGFSVKLPPEAVKAMLALPGVAYIEADQIVSLSTIQTGPPTGLDRIDRRLLPLNNTYTYSETGAGVNAYILDTGIRATHTDFGGRATGEIDRG